MRENVVGIELKFQVKSFHPKFIKNESVWQTAKAPRRQGLFSLTPTFDFTHTGRNLADRQGAKAPRLVFTDPHF